MQDPVALGALALTHPCQGRHRPRPLACRIVGVGQAVNVSELGG